MAGIMVTGIGFKIETWYNSRPPSWESQQVRIMLDPCGRGGCEVKTVQAKEPTEIKTTKTNLKPQVSDRALACASQHPEVAKKIVEKFGEYSQEATELLTKESCLNPQAVNSSSGACGIFQSYPCAKMGCSLDDVNCQMEWGANYVNKRYGNAKNALQFHLENNWY